MAVCKINSILLSMMTVWLILDFLHLISFRRYVSNSTFFEELVSLAEETEGAKKALGGNAPVMAKRFQMEGCRVLLASTVSDDLLARIHPEIKGTHFWYA